MSKSGQPPDLKKVKFVSSLLCRQSEEHFIAVKFCTKRLSAESRYMDRKLNIKLNANRMVVGVLRGFDQFMNLVLDNTVEINGNERNDIGMVKRPGLPAEADDMFVEVFKSMCSVP